MHFTSENNPAQLGGLAANAQRDTKAHAEMMRRAIQDGYQTGHDCRLCRRIDIPADITPEERQRRAHALWQLHWARMRRQKARFATQRKAKAAA